MVDKKKFNALMYDLEARKALRKDAKSYLKEIDALLDEDFRFKVHTDSKKTFYFVIPDASVLHNNSLKEDYLKNIDAAGDKGPGVGTASSAGTVGTLGTITASTIGTASTAGSVACAGSYKGD